MDISLFDYVLPKNRIAQAPVRPRERAKMLVYERATARVQDRRVADITSLLHAGDLLVLNTTKVRHALLKGKRHTESGTEACQVLVLAPQALDGQFECIITGKKVRAGQIIDIENSTTHLTIIDQLPDLPIRYSVQTTVPSANFLAECERIGNLPLPPYIENPSLHGFEDELYQPIIAKHLGSVASPTASLHFSSHLLEDLRMRGVGQAEVILHVGMGTFAPVKVTDTDAHVMHPESVEVSQSTVNAIKRTKFDGGRVIALGTTVARALESAASYGQLEPYVGQTRLYIQPSYKFKVIDGLLTNFHMPKSTLLMLVAAFIGREVTLDLYHHALQNDYRFLSFGDCMLLL